MNPAVVVRMVPKQTSFKFYVASFWPWLSDSQATRDVKGMMDGRKIKT